MIKLRLPLAIAFLIFGLLGLFANDALAYCLPDSNPCTIQTSTGTSLPTQCQVTYEPAGTPCDPSEAGACQQQGQCNGSGACINTIRPAGSVCRTSAGDCDVAETCNGTSANCPTDTFAPVTRECRASTGVCDATEFCTGIRATCPVNTFAPAGTNCSDANACTTGEACNLTGVCTGGTARDCNDGLTCTTDTCNTSSGCRNTINAGTCLIGGVCYANGETNPASPCQECNPIINPKAWSPKPAGTICRGSADTCDIVEVCTNTGICPADKVKVVGTICRASADVCDVAEACNGTSAACPANAFSSATTQCRASAGVCDVAEACNGTSAACPADAKQTAGTECRASEGECDLAEACNGTAATCPADAKKTAGTACAADETFCTDDVCNGTDVTCAHPERPGCECEPGQTRPCYSGSTSSRHVGACSDGIQTCSASGTWGECTGSVLPAPAEICNNIDDDCDGVIDNGLTRQCGSTDAGECAFGAETCSIGTWSGCNAIGPTPEVCDGLDNDCDGETDEGVTNTCTNYSDCRTYTTCDACPIIPAEICDGLDNDCNGSVDEDLGSTTCGVGMCEVTQNNCIYGRPHTCTPGTPTTEVCNGMDNDCDGQTDEGFNVGGECTVGRGECQQSGHFICDPSMVGAICDATASRPQTEICDGLDNDCDGQADEPMPCALSGLTDPACGEGQRVCAGGVYGECAAANTGSSCRPDDGCTTGWTCLADGTCRGAPVPDPAPNSAPDCFMRECNPQTGWGTRWDPRQDNQPCDDGNACTGSDACIARTALDSESAVASANLDAARDTENACIASLSATRSTAATQIAACIQDAEGQANDANNAARAAAIASGASPEEISAAGSAAYDRVYNEEIIACNDLQTAYNSQIAQLETECHAAETTRQEAEDYYNERVAIYQATLASPDHCRGGPLDTNDNNVCTTDSCDPATGIAHVSINIDDDNACTADSCDPVTGAAHTPIPVDDGIACTTDSCDTATGAISHAANNAACSDANACTTDTCNTATGCEFPPIPGSSGAANACGGCAILSQTIGAPCGDCGTWACDGVDNVKCVGGGATDTQACGTAPCSGTQTRTCAATGAWGAFSACDYSGTNGAACSDSNACTQTDICVSGACAGSNPVVCTASDQCHDAGTCDAASGACSNPAKTDGATCNDGDVCTRSDACTNGACAGTPDATVGNNCSAGVGACAQTGTLRCNTATGITECSATAGAPATEVCNGIDDDCDGVVDDHLEPETEPCGLGICAGGTRQKVCATGAWSEWSACSTATRAIAETCDGLDNDCDGESDEGLVGDTECPDDGNPCTIDIIEGAGCAARCAHNPGNAGAECRASGDVCDVAEICSGTNAACPADSFTAAGTVCRAAAGDCDAAESCTGSSATCPADAFSSATTQCRASAGVCDIAESCTGSSASCPDNAYKPTATECRPATAGDACDAPEFCTGADAPCPPADANQPDGTTCNDDNACTRSDTCQTGTCTGENPVICTASDQCHDAGVCNPATGTCSNPARSNGSTCDDGNLCTENDTCSAGSCQAGAQKNCDDGDACTIDTCSAGTCSNIHDPACICAAGQTQACATGRCTGQQACGASLRAWDVCVPQVCTCDPAERPACAGSGVCAGTATCNTSTGNWNACVYPSSSTTCDDGSACTENTTCMGNGSCGNGSAISTNDNNVCTTDSCDPATGISHVATNTDDGNACTVDSCDPVAGVAHTQVPVDDAVSCTVDSCNTTTGAIDHAANNAACSDSNACTTDTCNASTGCEFTPVPGSSGTANTCGGCAILSQTIGAPCGDCGTWACDGVDNVRCAGGRGTDTQACGAAPCSGTMTRSCKANGTWGDFSACDYTGTNGAACNDNDACTQTDKCAAGTCAGSNPIMCRASDQCHNAGMCDAATGACSNPPKADGVSCNDGDICTQSDACAGGACAGTRDATIGNTCSAGVGACAQTGALRCNTATGITECAATAGAPAMEVCNGIDDDCDGVVDDHIEPEIEACGLGICAGGTRQKVCATGAWSEWGACSTATRAVAEICDGLDNDCDGVIDNGLAGDTTCEDDGNPCTIDIIEGAGCAARCVHNAGNAGAECRASADVCDVAEVCSGTSAACPADSFTAAGTVCRAAAGDCDAAESCTGTSAACPANAYKPATTECRPATAGDTCDAPEFCTGADAPCPSADANQPDGTTCNDDNACTRSDTCQTGTCTGANPVVCTASDQCHDAGVCNPATGACSNPARSDGSTCDDGDACTENDSCSAGSCQAGSPKNCDDGDACTDDSCADGACVHTDNGTCCPAGQTQSCTVGNCTGRQTCGATVRAWGECVIETCTCDPAAQPNCGTGACAGSTTCNTADGTWSACDYSGKAGIECRPSAGACDVAATCDGTTATCPANAFVPNTTECRARDAANACDLGANCSGSAAACPESARITECTSGDGCCADECTAGEDHDCAGCGNGRVETGEECDTGIAAGQPGACPTECADDNNSCTDNGVVGSACTARCIYPAVANGVRCDDGNACTTTDVCSEGACAGTPTVCDSGDMCKINGSCGADGTCAYVDITACANGDGCCPAGCNSGNDNDCEPGCGNGFVDAGETCDTAIPGGSGACPTECAAPEGDLCKDASIIMGGSCQAACEVTNKADGTACDDATVCNGHETCRTGVCTSGEAPSCDDSNPCTDDSCDATTGCAHADNTAACNDLNACTQTDTCSAGICVGSNPVVCAAEDECHDVGTCDTATGECSNPPKADGAACNDNDACTQTDACANGACAGTNPVVCAASDQCHDAGTCDAATGACSNPPKADGVACNDGDICTQSDACAGGACAGTHDATLGNTCTVGIGACAQTGALRCNTATGITECSATAGAPATEVCNGIDDDCDGVVDDHIEPEIEACGLGICAGGTRQKTCAVGAWSEWSACSAATRSTAEICDGLDNDCDGVTDNGLTGDTTCTDDDNPCTDDIIQGSACAARCVHPPKTDGAACDDGNACTAGDRCGNGACIGGAAHACADDGNVCTTESCDPARGCVSSNNSSQCDDGNGCTQTDTCADGTCTGANPVVCAASDQCHAAGTCDPATGACSNPPLQNGAACADAILCNPACQEGVCVGIQVGAETCDGLDNDCDGAIDEEGACACAIGASRACGDVAACRGVETCIEASGVRAWSPCDFSMVANVAAECDSNLCTTGDGCNPDGTCRSGEARTCADNDSCTTDSCNPSTGECVFAAEAGLACNDNNACTIGDSCNASGQCAESTSRITDCLSADGCCPAGCNTTALNTDTDCPAGCGNGILEAGEMCDTGITDPAAAGACPAECPDSDNNACTREGVVGELCQAHCAVITTTDGCSIDGACRLAGEHNGQDACQICRSEAPNAWTTIVECANGDGCCNAANCNAANDSDCRAVCGNLALESGETCDTAIPPGEIGSCPRACGDDGDGNACTTLKLIQNGCLTACLPEVNDGCSIDGVCAGVEVKNTADACLICRPGRNQTAWSAIDERVNGDGCCATGSTAAFDTDCPGCGNGRIEAGEECDASECGSGTVCNNCRCARTAEEIQPEPPTTRAELPASEPVEEQPQPEPQPQPVQSIEAWCMSYCDGASDRVKQLNKDAAEITGWKSDLFCNSEIARVIIVCTVPLAGAAQTTGGAPDVSTMSWAFVQEGGRAAVPADPAWRDPSAGSIAKPVVLLSSTRAPAEQTKMFSLFAKSGPISEFMPLTNAQITESGGRMEVNGGIITHDTRFAPSMRDPFSMKLGSDVEIQFATPAHLATDATAAIPVEQHVVTVVLPAGASWTGVEGGPEGETGPRNPDEVLSYLADLRDASEASGTPITPENFTDLPWNSGDNFRFSIIESTDAQGATEGLKTGKFTALGGPFGEEGGGGGGCSIAKRGGGNIMPIMSIIVLMAITGVLRRRVKVNANSKLETLNTPQI